MEEIQISKISAIKESQIGKYVLQRRLHVFVLHTFFCWQDFHAFDFKEVENFTDFKMFCLS